MTLDTARFGALIRGNLRPSKLQRAASVIDKPAHLTDEAAQVLLSSHSRGAPGWMKRLWWCGRQRDWFCLGVSEPVTEFDRRPFEHPLLSPGTVAGQLRSASVLEHVRETS